MADGVLKLKSDPTKFMGISVSRLLFHYRATTANFVISSYGRHPRWLTKDGNQMSPYPNMHYSVYQFQNKNR